MSIKIKCQYCDEICGVRQEIVFRLLKGATVEILATCRKCNQPPPKPSNDFDIKDLLKGLGMN